MKMVIELESLDDLINLIGLARYAHADTKQQPKSELIKEAFHDYQVQQLKKQEETKKFNKEAFLDRPIEYLGLRKIAENALKKNGIFKNKDIYDNHSLETLGDIPLIGASTVKHIEEVFGYNNIRITRL